MAKGAKVQELTERALRQNRATGSGRAKSGPWVVGVDASGTYVQHYGYTVAKLHQGQVVPRPREGHGLSISDADGIEGFARGLDAPIERSNFKRNPYAYSSLGEPVMVRGHAEPHSSPYHHVGPCDEACRRGQVVHPHRRTRAGRY